MSCECGCGASCDEQCWKESDWEDQGGMIGFSTSTGEEKMNKLEKTMATMKAKVAEAKAASKAGDFELLATIERDASQIALKYCKASPADCGAVAEQALKIHRIKGSRH